MPDPLELIQQKIRTYSTKGIEFYEPHFSSQMILRGGNKRQVMDNLTNPDRLVYVEQSLGKYGDVVYDLFFLLEPNKVLILPVILNPTKGLYVLTYIMRARIPRRM